MCGGLTRARTASPWLIRRTLVSLSLDKGNITDESVVAFLGEIIMVNTTLSQLSLAFNPGITDKTAKVRAAGHCRARTMQHSH